MDWMHLSSNFMSIKSMIFEIKINNQIESRNIKDLIDINNCIKVIWLYLN